MYGRYTTATVVLLLELLIVKSPWLDVHNNPWQTVWEVVPMEFAAIYHIVEAYRNGHLIEHQIVACAYSALAASTAAAQLQVTARNTRMQFMSYCIYLSLTLFYCRLESLQLFL
jgi:hypothetical protein